MPGSRVLRPVLTFDAASPMISRSFMTASVAIRSWSSSVLGLRPRSAALQRLLPACAATGSNQIRSYCGTEVARTSSRKYRLRSPGIRRSTLRPIMAESSRSSRARVSNVGRASSSNSTKTSTSLEAWNRSVRTDPNSESLRMRLFAQKTRSASCGMEMGTFGIRQTPLRSIPLFERQGARIAHLLCRAQAYETAGSG